MFKLCNVCLSLHCIGKGIPDVYKTCTSGPRSMDHLYPWRVHGKGPHGWSMDLRCMSRKRPWTPQHSRKEISQVWRPLCYEWLFPCFFFFFLSYVTLTCLQLYFTYNFNILAFSIVTTFQLFFNPFIERKQNRSFSLCRRWKNNCLSELFVSFCGSHLPFQKNVQNQSFTSILKGEKTWFQGCH